eukprot:TRINITY_DN1983_c0_g1_i1.p1 TRINITY_DN1983_c0_g1~~TRINITY_DN1983_c0_g1_i1.p1  ORF type:complete len:315 (-),score=91.19 TRINITY_DN1983_c0_g1_i1:167-1111(-)
MNIENFANVRVEILEYDNDHLKFELSNVDVAFANALRRVMIAEVPTMAIELVEIKNNTSPLHDEFISQRLGLVPLESSRVDQFVYRKECQKCSSGCDECSVRFRLQLRNHGEETVNVTSRHLEQILSDRPENADIKPVKYRSVLNEEAGIVITKLGKNQEIDLECTAVKGIGQQHTKWSPSCVSNFAHVPDIAIKETVMAKLNREEKLEFVNSCPTRVYNFNTRQQSVEIAQPNKCMFCDECVKKGQEILLRHDDLRNESLVKIGSKPNQFVFSIETNGSLRPEEIVINSIRVLRNKIAVVRNELENSTVLSNR